MGRAPPGRACATAARLVLAGALMMAAACAEAHEPKSWQLVVEDLPGAMLSVWGTSSTDVWAVGGDARDGTGPQVLHFDGNRWRRIRTGETQGNLWWVFGFKGGPVFMGGEGGTILRYEDNSFTKMQTPGRGTVFGIWGGAPDDVWALGSASPSSGGFAWRLRGDAWIDEPSLPATIAPNGAMWKVHGRSTSDVWLVGGHGISLHFDGTSLQPVETGATSSLFNVHCNDAMCAAVGGDATGVILEYDGSSWANATPDSAPALTGISLSQDGTGYAVGHYGQVFERVNDTWQEAQLGFVLEQALHGAWTDPEGGMWVAGGQSSVTPLTEGLLLHYGEPVPTIGL